MKIYSKSIGIFLKRINLYIREILQNEFSVRVERNRFHLRNGWNYPIVIVALDDPKILGQFNCNDFSIGINRSLMFNAKTTVIKNILRHELAHYLLYIKDNNAYNFIKPHGIEFQDFCKDHGFGKEVYSASVDIKKENDSLIGDLKTEKIIIKIRKLLSLAESDNQHEAELATIKANQLITQYNIDAILQSSDSSEISSNSIDDIEYFTKLVLKGTRGTPRMSAIASILTDFFVFPVKTRDGLEITGTIHNIENGEYIANFLDHELKKIWRRHKSQNPRLLEKAFMVSLSISFKCKLQESKKLIPKADLKSLAVLDKELSFATTSIYGGHISHSSTKFKSCNESSRLGSKEGDNLTINRGVSKKGRLQILLKS